MSGLLSGLSRLLGSNTIGFGGQAGAAPTNINPQQTGFPSAGQPPVNLLGLFSRAPVARLPLPIGVNPPPATPTPAAPTPNPAPAPAQAANPNPVVNPNPSMLGMGTGLLNGQGLGNGLQNSALLQQQQQAARQFAMAQQLIDMWRQRMMPAGTPQPSPNLTLPGIF